MPPVSATGGYGSNASSSFGVSEHSRSRWSFLSGAALEKRTQLQELRLISEDSKYARILRPDGMRLFAGDKLLGAITSRDQGEFGLTAEVELTDPRATVVKLATYGLTLGTG